MKSSASGQNLHLPTYLDWTHRFRSAISLGHRLPTVGSPSPVISQHALLHNLENDRATETHLKRQQPDATAGMST